jgi:hypothetical protein
MLDHGQVVLGCGFAKADSGKSAGHSKENLQNLDAGSGLSHRYGKLRWFLASLRPLTRLGDFAHQLGDRLNSEIGTLPVLKVSKTSTACVASRIARTITHAP